MSILRTSLLAIVLTATLVGAGSTRPAAAPSAAMTPASPVAPNTSDAAKSDALSDAASAKQVFESLSTKYRLLDNVTVTIGDTPNGEQAVAYYTDGQIVISRDHTVGIDIILAHEVWHIIDWRDNGRLDWGEELPPSNPQAYLQ